LDGYAIGVFDNVGFGYYNSVEVFFVVDRFLPGEDSLL